MTSFWRTPIAVLTCGALMVCIALGIRHVFGLFLQPVSTDFGWGREVFAFAIALQNLIWGISQPFAGRLADRYGAGWIVISGILIYLAGLLLMSQLQNQWMLIISAGILVGVGLSGTTFPVIFGVISRTLPAEKRSWAMGITMSVGSFGQFAFLPLGNTLISNLGWSDAIIGFAILAACMLLLAPSLMEKPKTAATTQPVSLTAILQEAANHRGFWLLSLGFFVCGFQVVFIALHLPAFLVDRGLSAATGAVVLGLIGLFNIFGSYLAGHFGAKRSKPKLLSFLYSARLVVIAVFVFLPLTSTSAYLFGMLIGLLWLSTVPLTNGTVASIFGVENLSMLGGIVFLFHQIGAFLGGWLGGWLYDLTGSYDIVWIIAMGLSAMAAVLNWPIKEEPIARLQAEAAQ